MFERIRKWSHRGLSVKSIGAFLIFSAIVMVFVLFGFPQKDLGGGTGALVQVNNAFIAEVDIRQAEARTEQMYSKMFGGSSPAFGEAQRQFFRNQAIEGLIEQELLAQLAQKEGVRVTNDEVVELITKDMDVFKENGRFSRERYLGLLQANNMDFRSFESKIRKDTAAARLRQAVLAASKPLKLEEEKLRALKSREFKVAVLKFTREALIANAKIDEGRIPELLKDAEFQKKLETEYQFMKAQFTTPEKISAKHILFKFKPKDAADQKRAVAKANDVKAKLTIENFSEMAKTESQDMANASLGGDLGWIARGGMPMEFDQVAFSAPVGKIQGPIVAEAGVHLVLVQERRAAVTKELKDVATEVAKSLLKKTRADEALKSLDGLLAAGELAPIEKLAKENLVQWQNSDWFDLTSDGIPAISSAKIFSEVRTLSKGNPLLKKSIEDSGHYYVVKLLEERSFETAQKVREEERRKRMAQAKLKSSKKNKGLGPEGRPAAESGADADAVEGLTEMEDLAAGDAAVGITPTSRGFDVFRAWMDEKKKVARIVR